MAIRELWMKQGWRPCAVNLGFSACDWLIEDCSGRILFEICRYFSEIAGDSADTDVNLLTAADAPLSCNIS